MKGVSEVIAIILILMIVIALSALAYTWFSGIFASMTQSAGTAVTTTTSAMATQFRIESVRYGGTVGTGTNVTIRNTGTQNINGSLVMVYIAGQVAPYQGISTGTSNIGQYGSAVIYNVSNSTAYSGVACGSVLTVTIGTGLTDSRTIVC